MTALLQKIKRRIQRNLKRNTPLRHDWREARSGPLQGLQFYLPSGDGVQWADRFLTGDYEPEMLTALGELAQHGGTLYDIGAHIGFYSCAWLKLGGERVEAFEPAPYNREILTSTLQRNGFSDKANIHPFALGDREGTATLVASRQDIGAASAAYLQEFGGIDMRPGLPSSPLPGTEQTTVPLRTLDMALAGLNLPIPTLLKLDIEGAEAAALAGAQALLARHHPAILCEIHTAEAALLLADQLARASYTLQILGKNGPHVACLWTHHT